MSQPSPIPPSILRIHIRSTLQIVSLWSESAEELLLGTAAQESQLGRYRRQLGNGPARGLYQMEPATEADTWNNYLSYHRDLIDLLHITCGVIGPNPLQLEHNLTYQTIMARLHYRRVPGPLPAPDNIPAQAGYWKKHYNTVLGKGTIEEYINNYRRYVAAE